MWIFKDRVKLRKVDWVVNIICIGMLLIPSLIFEWFDFPSHRDLYFPLIKAIGYAPVIAFSVFAIASWAMRNAHLLVYIVKIDDEHKEQIFTIYYNMLNIIKLFGVFASTTLMPVYTILRLPLILLAIPVIFILLFIVKYYIDKMRKLGQD